VSVAVPPAREALALRRSFLRRRFTLSDQVDRATTVYSVVFGVVLAGVLLWPAIGNELPSRVAPSLSSRTLAVAGPALLLALLVLVLGTSTWRGPVVFLAADVQWLVTSPLDRAELVRPRLRRSFVLGWLGGLAGGAVLLPLLLAAPRIPVGHALLALLGAAWIGLAASALGWFVVLSSRRAVLVARATPLVLLAGALVAAASLASPAVRSAALWIVPWGWAVVPLARDGAAAAGIASVLLAAAALLVAAAAWRRAGACPTEELLRRAETRSAVAAAAYAGDYRGTMLARRAANARLRGGRARRVPAPRSARLALTWRDLVTYVRAPLRPVAGLAAIVVGVRACVAAGRYPLAVVIVAVVSYLAIGLLLEPLRFEVDVPSRARALLPWTLGETLLRHCVLPAVLAAVVGLAAAIPQIAAAQPEVALLSVLLGVLVAVALVLAAANGATAGGRVSLDRLLATAMDATGLTFVLYLLRWPLAGAAIVAVPALVVSIVAHEGHPLVGPLVVLGAVEAAAGAGLAWWLRRWSAD
jgi:hypothetical protein